MVKKFLFIFSFLYFVSCSSLKWNRNHYPSFMSISTSSDKINISLSDLNNSDIEKVGRIVGKSVVSMSENNLSEGFLYGDTGGYAVFNSEVDNYIKMIVNENGSIPSTIYHIAVANAYYDMLRKSQKYNVDFFIFPQCLINVDHANQIIEVTASAVGCKFKGLNKIN